jgi:hypothetical protein
VAMMVLLMSDADGEFCLRCELMPRLSRLGITHIALVRDEQTVAVVFEGWSFDPVRSAREAAHVVGAAPRARTLHPVMQLAVSTVRGKED